MKRTNPMGLTESEVAMFNEPRRRRSKKWITARLLEISREIRLLKDEKHDLQRRLFPVERAK